MNSSLRPPLYGLACLCCAVGFVVALCTVDVVQGCLCAAAGLACAAEFLE